jgi:hypothetical protein
MTFFEFTVHHAGERKAAERGYENNGTTKLAALVGLVHQVFCVPVHFCDIDNAHAKGK